MSRTDRTGFSESDFQAKLAELTEKLGEPRLNGNCYEFGPCNETDPSAIIQIGQTAIGTPEHKTTYRIDEWGGEAPSTAKYYFSDNPMTIDITETTDKEGSAGIKKEKFVINDRRKSTILSFERVGGEHFRQFKIKGKSACTSTKKQVSAKDFEFLAEDGFYTEETLMAAFLKHAGEKSGTPIESHTPETLSPIVEDLKNLSERFGEIDLIP